MGTLMIHELTVSDHEPLVSQLTNSISDPKIQIHQFQQVPNSHNTPLCALQLSHGETLAAQNLTSYLTPLMTK